MLQPKPLAGATADIVDALASIKNTGKNADMTVYLSECLLASYRKGESEAIKRAQTERKILDATKGKKQRTKKVRAKK